MRKVIKYIRNNIVWYFNLWSAIRVWGKIFIDKSSAVNKNSKIYVDGKLLKIGKNTTIHEDVYIRLYGGFISIGDNCSINPYCVIYGHGGLEIGSNVRIAAHCTIIPSNHIFDNINIPITEQGEKMLGIKIMDDVWIGTGVRVLDGVTIGQGSVIGAGSVVTKSIPDYSVVVGIPAKILKKRGMSYEKDNSKN